MKPFTEAPLTAKTLSARLNKYGFWTRQHLDIAVAKNAVLAAKLATQVEPSKAVPQAIRNVLPTHGSVDSHELLNKMYRFGPIREQLPQLWRELLVVEPAPPWSEKLQLLQTLLRRIDSSDEAETVIATVLKSEVARGSFTNAFPLLRLVPLKSPFAAIAAPALCIGLATTSLVLWLPALPIGLGLFTFWTGLAINGLRPQKLPRVSWNKWKQPAGLTERRRAGQLKMASVLVTAFEELQSLNVANYHRRAQAYHPRLAQDELKLINGLREFGIELKPVDHTTELYADYWSDQNLRWNTVEWYEPDQDPADIEMETKDRERPVGNAIR